MKNLRQSIISALEQSWYTKSGLTPFLRPVSWLYIGAAVIRRILYRFSIIKATRLPIPVIVVGNITVGGTGKTPLVIWLANYLKQAGFKPGIISRGYAGNAQRWPQQVRPDADPVMVGDEALVIARRTNCPMAVGPDRVAAANALLKHAAIDVIISDDGLQHYALERTIEIAVVDGVRRLGNGFCLPAGPLRERKNRLQNVDFIVTNGSAVQDEYAMRYVGDTAINMCNREERALSEFKPAQITAIAGIGNPDRFFNFLRVHGLRLVSKAFPDHHYFQRDELSFPPPTVLMMTEKDAVKCERFARTNWWYVPISVELPGEFGMKVLSLMESRHGQKDT